jgi:putative nucleotidyltransferase with HDIG domain
MVLYFTFSMSMGRIEDANRHLTQLNSLYMSTIETLAMAIDAKDQITHGHIRRVQAYAVSLATEVGVTDSSLIRAVEAAALLHDMGKLAVPEYILNKPGPLTTAEFARMKLHSSVGADILSAIDFPYPVVPIVRHHHENWDGTGYPDGLTGTNIPIGARILAVVDCFDALTSDRPYRPRLSDKEALRILIERRGSMYDPLVVDTFLKLHPRLSTPATASTPTASLLAIGTGAATPLFNQPQTRSLEEIAGSTDEMVTLFDLARALASPLTVAESADVVSRHLRRLIPCSLCIIFVYDANADELVVAHSDGENSSLVAGLRIGLGQRLSGWVAAHRQTIRNSDPVLDLGDSARAIEPRPRSCLSTPLDVDGELVGVLTLYSTGANAFSEEHQRIIEVVSRQVAPIVRRSTCKSEARVPRSKLDDLPSIDHLRHFTEAVGLSELPRPTSILLVTIDTSSEAGRAASAVLDDTRLIGLLEMVKRHLRERDLLFRRGLGELLVLLLKTDVSAASSIAARIQRGAQESQGFLVVQVNAAAVGTRGEDALTALQLVEQAAATIRFRRSSDVRQDPPGSIH